MALRARLGGMVRAFVAVALCGSLWLAPACSSDSGVATGTGGNTGTGGTTTGTGGAPTGTGGNAQPDGGATDGGARDGMSDAVAAYAPCPATAATACAVLPLGDSITEGYLPTGANGGYRVELFSQAVQAGKNITF